MSMAIKERINQDYKQIICKNLINCTDLIIQKFTVRINFDKTLLNLHKNMFYISLLTQIK